MSFKAIDLQFAVHKNDEAGIRQNQLMQKPRQDETILENQAAQSTEKIGTAAASLKKALGLTSMIMVGRSSRWQRGSLRIKAFVISLFRT